MRLRMGSVFFSVFALLLLFQPSAAEPYVELDLDGVLGNGPDAEAASPGDTVEVAVWLHHEHGFCAMEVSLVSACAMPCSVAWGDYYDSEYSLPDAGPDTLLIRKDSWFLCEPPLPPPYFFYATVWYVAEECPCSLVVSDATSWYFDTYFTLILQKISDQTAFTRAIARHLGPYSPSPMLTYG